MALKRISPSSLFILANPFWFAMLIIGYTFISMIVFLQKILAMFSLSDVDMNPSSLTNSPLDFLKYSISSSYK